MNYQEIVVPLSGFIKVLWWCGFVWLSANSFSLAQDSEAGSIVDISTPEESLPCGSRAITIAQMQWPSSIILAHVHGILLGQELGCDVQYVPGDMAATASSMATTGEPSIAPELWISRIAPIWNSVLETERIRSEGASFVAANFEGWFLPAHVGDKLPDVTSAVDLKENLTRMLLDESEFSENATAEEGEEISLPEGKVRFISCPTDWACSLINKNLLSAYGLLDLVELVVPANRFEMDTLIAQAVSNQQPVFFYYWQPNAVLAQFEFVELDMGEFDEEHFKCLAQVNCAQPEPSSFGGEKPFIVVSDWVADDVPLVSSYLRRAAMPIDEMSTILNWQSEGNTDFAELAARFVAEREEIWRPWVDGLRE